MGQTGETMITGEVISDGRDVRDFTILVSARRQRRKQKEVFLLCGKNDKCRGDVYYEIEMNKRDADEYSL